MFNWLANKIVKKIETNIDNSANNDTFGDAGRYKSLQTRRLKAKEAQLKQAIKNIELKKKIRDMEEELEEFEEEEEEETQTTLSQPESFEDLLKTLAMEHIKSNLKKGTRGDIVGKSNASSLPPKTETDLIIDSLPPQVIEGIKNGSIQKHHIEKYIAKNNLPVSSDMVDICLQKIRVEV